MEYILYIYIYTHMENMMDNCLAKKMTSSAFVHANYIDNLKGSFTDCNMYNAIQIWYDRRLNS